MDDQSNKTLDQILETMASRGQALATQTSPKKSYADRMKNADEEFKRRWINSRLNLDKHHPDVARLEHETFEFCRGFCANPVRGKRLIVFGNNGVAKTKCARAVKRWVYERAQELPLVTSEDGTGAALVECIMVNWAHRVDRMFSGDWDIERYFTVDMLIVDDIGAEHDPNKSSLEKLYLILERRERKWTWINTNFPPDKWEEKFERRVADRLFRNSIHLDLTNVPSYSVNT